MNATTTPLTEKQLTIIYELNTCRHCGARESFFAQYDATASREWFIDPDTGERMEGTIEYDMNDELLGVYCMECNEEVPADQIDDLDALSSLAFSARTGIPVIPTWESLNAWKKATS